jgi:regulator of sirC expression with transglutaminase-like and TPR domain
MRSRALAVLLVLYAFEPANSSTSHTVSADQLRIVGSLLATPEGQIDFAKSKLAIDKLVDPAIDVTAFLTQVDQMTARVESMAGPDASAIKKLAAVRKFIYVAGEWNGYRPFQYDMSDPFGTNLDNKLLPTYVATRRGNCVSMPILFLILADRLGVHMAVSTAPLHVFLQYIDDKSGKTFNIETTSGGLPARDAWLRQSFPMTDAAIRNGVYLKTLSRKEALAVFAQLILEHDMQTRQYHALIDVAERILKYYPADLDAMLAEGTAYAHLIDVEFKQKYPNPYDIPPTLWPEYQLYARKNEELFDRAIALGWRDTENKVTTSLSPQ